MNKEKKPFRGVLIPRESGGSEFGGCKDTIVDSQKGPALNADAVDIISNGNTATASQPSLRALLERGGGRGRIELRLGMEILKRADAQPDSTISVLPRDAVPLIVIS